MLSWLAPTLMSDPGIDHRAAAVWQVQPIAHDGGSGRRSQAETCDAADTACPVEADPDRATPRNDTLPSAGSECPVHAGAGARYQLRGAVAVPPKRARVDGALRRSVLVLGSDALSADADYRSPSEGRCRAPLVHPA